MPQLHEILAVEKSLAKIAEKLRLETKRTFDKENLFKGFTKKLKMFKEQDQRLNESTYMKLETTVDENLNYLLPNVAKYWNTVLAKDRANQVAKADIVLNDGTVLAKDMPATFLLGLETKMGELRDVYNTIPTLAPGIDWVENTLERAGIYKDNNTSASFKTETKTEFVEASPATEFHPAQVVPVKNVNNIGEYKMVSECGMVSPLEKANRLTRFDEVFFAVKKARARANNTVIEKTPRVSEALFKYINTGT